MLVVKDRARFNVKQIAAHPWTPRESRNLKEPLALVVERWEKAKAIQAGALESKEINFAEFLLLTLQNSLLRLADDHAIPDLELFTSHLKRTEILTRVTSIFLPFLSSAPSTSFDPYLCVISPG